MRISKEYIFGAILLFATLFSTWLIFNASNEHVAANSKIHHPDMIVEKMVGTRMDLAGNIQNQFYAPKLQHYADTKTSDIDNPRLIVYNTDPNVKPWFIDARYGRAHDGLQQVEIWDNVKAYESAGLHNKETTLTTLAATLYPKQKYAITHEFITAIQPGTILRAIGATVDMNKGTTELLNQVQGQYESPTH